MALEFRVGKHGLSLVGAAAITGGEPVTITAADLLYARDNDDAGTTISHSLYSNGFPPTLLPIFLKFSGASARFEGNADANMVTGTRLDDSLFGNGGDDRLLGGRGGDLLDGGEGNDMLTGGGGSNTLDGGAGYDRVYYDGRSSDYVIDTLGRTTVLGSGSNDTVTNAEELIFKDRTLFLFDTPSEVDVSLRGRTLYIAGTAANDETHGRVVVIDYDGAITVTDNSEIPFVQSFTTEPAEIKEVNASHLAGAGLDFSVSQIYPRYSSFELIGSDFSDWLKGGVLADTIEGRAGGDVLDGGGGNDTLMGQSGADSLFGSYGDDMLTGGGDDDVLDGGSEKDVIFGGDGADHLQGGSGDDVLTGGLGDDLIDGGSDIDTAVYTGARSDYSVAISHGLYVISDLRVDGIDGTDRFGNVELFTFSDGTYSIADLLDTQAAGAPAHPTGVVLLL